MRLAIVLNQNLFERSAHMLYLARLAASLAQAQPAYTVHLIFPKGPSGTLALYDLSQPANLHLHPLPAIRKRKGQLGITLNQVFYHHCQHFLHTLQPNVIFSASFHKLFAHLLSHRDRLSARFVYEVHDLAELDEKPSAHATQAERQLLARVDTLLTTTQALAARLCHHGLSAQVLPLACAYKPADFPSPAPIYLDDRCFRVGYFGSTYQQQGISWLVDHWTGIDELHIFGPDRLRGPNVFCHEPQPMSTLAHTALPQLDALVIPSLPVGRMPTVAITKSYDYLAFGRPIIAANLPSITDVLRPYREALTFQAGHFASFQAALEELKADAALRARLAHAAGLRAQELSLPHRAQAFWRLISR